ncbi:MBL fold metallo-hydrolase [Saccharopolyspora sp. CA-218241]|uniref:MBL fold metallo-hydrolase n=1 Tax=Saccharopolyspora sp. CA-218241 TaxID=3240027 RepID=UPI003D95E116
MTRTGGALVEVAPGVHAWVQPDGSWWINNAGAVLAEDGALLVDTCATARRTRAFLDAVHAASGGTPVRWAVNTHLHGDHTHGNALLPADATLIGHRATREGILADTLLADPPPVWDPVPEWGITAHRAPEVVLHDRLDLHVGARRVELRHPGHAAHTAGDVVVWLPDDGVLFTGDLVFHQVTPLLLMGSVAGAVRSLDWLAGFGARVLVPGHGPVVPGERVRAVLDAHRRYYDFVLATGEHARTAGLTPLEAARRADLGEFADWPDAERLVLNLHRVRADAAGEPLDLPAALADAVTYHGGPLRCAV